MKITQLGKTLIGAAALTVASTGFALAADLTMGTTSPTSSHFTISVAMSKALEKGMPGTSVTVIETGASVDNVLRLSREEIDLGLATTNVLLAARNGTGKFDGHPVPDTVALYPYSSSVLLIAVRADSGVESLEDLAGKKFTAGIRGSSAEGLISQTLEMFGIDAELIYGTVGDAVEGIKNRQLVGYGKYGAGTSVDSTLQELMTSTDMRLIGYSQEQADAVAAAVEGIGFTTLKAGMIPGSKAVIVPKSNVFFLTRTGVMDDERAYNVAKSIHQNMEILIEAWPQLKGYDIAADAMGTINAGVPFHPGAERYWKEATGN